MAMTFTQSMTRDSAAYGGFVDAIGGVATVIVAIVGLAGARPDMMIGIATILFGAALLIESGAMLAEFAGITLPAGAQAMSLEQFGSGGLSALFLAGATGIVLGILALLGVHAAILTAVATIVFGNALVLSSNSVRYLHHLKRASQPEATTTGGAEVLANELAAGSAGIQAVVGLATVVLGILALAGGSDVLMLPALLALGATLVLTGGSLSWSMMSFMRGAAPQHG